jgi:hypothetical protein
MNKFKPYAIAAAMVVAMLASFSVASAAQATTLGNAPTKSVQVADGDQTCQMCWVTEICIEWKNGGETCFSMETCETVPCGGGSML